MIYPQPVITVGFSSDTLIGSAGFVSYQWYLDSLPVAGATNQQFLPLSGGSYFVTAIDSNGCVAVSPAIVSHVGIVSTDGMNHPGIVLFPNPFNRNITFEITTSSANREFLFELFNITGNKIRSFYMPLPDNGAKFLFSISLENLDPGIYFYKILFGPDFLPNYGKIIKQ